ncbi:MAG: homoserine O-acetyltransferase [Gordonia sp.]|uniref:homoserine O-acetyltransferase MetX n=2 Tax=Gordonia sp. (in: high G+C Gram-positive bacteria) TaxID=84139 RepID=UPI001DE4C32A|nr:homoserine O-acetyltransferase [Gordonia sp. (in: high G+C Gram-positive bacteria)]MCB1297007.1 homoserine O-acetyltransferase [Gordonia sp. (in: high G+C Gram-positive bacteria)]HQV18276.1 homoserine O-acetyltransferase [Gordonia sp. (in: high G+C Gram-positive bacteria)]
MPVSIDQPVAETTGDLDWENTPDGELMYTSVGPLTLDNGERLDDVTLAFQRWGTLSPARDNVVLTLHALTGDSHVTGPADENHPDAGWWDGLIGPGCAVDTGQWCVVSANVLGGCRGSTGPSSIAPDGRPWGSRFPRVTIGDQVRAELALMDALSIGQVASVLGGSMGGARALEWAVGHADRIRSALVLAVGARATADQIGIQSTQITAIKADPDWLGGDYYGTGRAPTTGMGIARRMAHLSYRAEVELDDRFGNDAQGSENPLADGRYAVESYLEHQSAKLGRRFDPGSYVVLTDSLNTHDVGRGRGGVEAALRGCTVPVVVGGIDSDRLYPLRLQVEIAENLGNAVGGLHVVRSDKGHDGFLTEADAIGDLLRYTTEIARAGRR